MDKTLKDALMGWGALAGIIAVAISTVLQYNLANDPEARADSYTGTQGAKHESRTERLEQWAIITDLRLQAIESRSEECRERADGLRQTIDGHLRISERKILEYNVILKEHDVKLKDCLDHLRNDR